MKRRTFIVMSAMATAAYAVRPIRAFAEISGETLDESISIAKLGDTFVIHDEFSGLTANVAVIDESLTTFTWSNGSTSQLTTEADGTQRLDGIKVGFKGSNNIAMVPTAKPSGYVLLKQNKTKVSTYAPAVDLVALIVGYVPVIGNAYSIASYIRSLSGSYSDAYMLITQYYHPNTKYIYTIVKLYKNSNYTGLLRTFEDGPRAPV